MGAGVLLYCGTQEEQIAWLRAAAAALHFNGVLIIDVPGPALSLDPATNGQPLLVFAGEGRDGDFECWHVHEDDLATQTRWLRVHYDQTDGEGRLRRVSSDHQLRYVYPFELQLLLSSAGFGTVDLYGDYDLGPLTNDSDCIIAVARRPE